MANSLTAAVFGFDIDSKLKAEIAYPTLEKLSVCELNNFEVIWIIGQARVLAGITYPYSHTLVGRDRYGKLINLGWPHSVVIDQCPVYCCIPNKADEITLLFIESTKNAIANLRAA